MATVVTPPGGFHTSLRANLAKGTAAADVKAGGAGHTLQNPLMAGALGDPSLNQNFGGGLVGGFLQGLQANKQHETFTKQQQDLSAAMDRFSQATQEAGGDRTKGFNTWLTNNPKDMLLLHQAGIKPADLMAGQTGNIQTGNLHGKDYIIDSKGGVHFAPNTPNPNQGSGSPWIIGPDGKTPGRIGHNGQWENAPAGARIPSDVTNERTVGGANDRAADKNQGITYKRDPSSGQMFGYPKDGSPPFLAPNVTSASGQEPTVKLKPQETNFYANSQQVYRALDDMQQIASGVLGPISGKLATLVGGKMLGENPIAIRWNADLLSAQNGIASKDMTNYYNTSKEELANLPSAWNAPANAIASLEKWKRDIQSRVQVISGAHESNGQLPGSAAEAAANVGVYTKQYSPIVQKLHNNPDSLTHDDLIALANGQGALSPADKAIAAKAAQRATQSQAQFAAPQPMNPQAQPQQQMAPGQQPQPQASAEPQQAAPAHPPMQGSIPIQPAGPGSPNPTRNFTPPASAPNTLSNEAGPILNPLQPGQTGQPVSPTIKPNRSELQQNQEDLQREISSSPNG